MPAPSPRCARSHRTLGLCTGLLIGATLLAADAGAQTPPPAKPNASPPAAKAAKPAKEGAGAVSGSSDAALKQRVDTLEEQLTDMQVVVGTLESFAKSNGAASASPTYRAGAPEPATTSSADQGRIAGLEAQVKSLTLQLQGLTEQVRNLNARRSDLGSGASVAAPPPITPAAAPSPGFGSATVTAASGDGRVDQIKDLIGSDAVAAPQPLPAAAAPADGAAPKQLYETAYGYLLQQDYGAAETAFDDFLKRYPNDPLAGNAQFWLGESYFVRAQYKPAASAFLKGYQTYARSSKAPDSLLKLAMSLGRMGQKEAACSSFGELQSRFPAASADVKSRAAAEKQRVGCP